MVDAQDAGSKLFSKSRWKTKIFEKTAEIAAANQAKTARTPDDDLDAFLKPSTDRVAQQQKEAAAAALFSRPRIDVASAQRWPSAQVILANAAAKSPGPGGLKTGTRKKGLTVGFVRSVPEVIGHGGDECEDPTIEVSQNKKAATASQVEKPPVLVPQDDANVTARSNGIGRTASQTEYRTQLTRTHTNPGELSPPLGQKMQIGQINSTAQLPPTPPRYMGSMGLGERPKPLSRAPTGFDSIMEAVGNAPGRRQSEDSVYSQDSDNLSPTISRNVSVREPTIQEEDVIQPKMLKRTQTGFSTLGDDDAHEPVHPIPSVPHLPEQRLAEQEEDGPNSFAARVKQRMRSEEGRTLHEAAQRAAETERRDSESSSQLSMAGTPPSSYRTPATARTPHESSQVESRGSPRPMDPEDPHRSRATQGRRPMGHAIQTDMEPRSPSVASSQYAPFSPLSQTRTSPPLGGNIHSHSPMQWLRVATWWFLKGRTGMENMIRSQPRNGEPPQERLAQPHVDLAKVWWIITEVLPNHPGLQSYGDASPNAQVDLARQAGDAASAEAYDIQNALSHYMKLLVGSMKKHQNRVPMNAVMSVLRSKNEYQVKLSICSQNSLINVQVGSGSAIGWKDVNWKQQSQQITVQLRHGFLLTLALHEVDFRSLWSIINHTNRVESDIRERKDERFASKIYLREASYRDPASPGAFAPDRVKDCKLLVFQKIERSSEGTGKRKLHRGYRMVLVTPQHVKQVSVINHEFGTKNEPMNFEYVTEPDQAPALRLRFREEGPDKKLRVCTAHLVFHDSRERNDIFGTFTSMNVAEGETTFAQVSLKAYHIESADQAEGFSQQGSRVLERLQWVEAKVVNQDPEAAGLESAPTVMSESLRIMCRHTAGIVCDRMNLGPGELLVRLPVDGSPELTLLREAQQDLSVAVDASRTEPNVPDALAELLKTLTSATTIRRLTFNSYQDLHTFQLAVTGFNVKFDGLACTFSISRRRMVVPIYKQWTANRLRLQIVEQDNIVQLLAFFEDFSHADAMNFQLRTMDTFEKTDKGGKFGLKLVDAKFALPVDERRGEGKIQKAEGRLTGWSGTKRRFVCLDEIEYPGEHDDILIMFDSAETRDRFAEALPAATMERKFTVRRKI
ncbi:conserved hypothetical protein [Pyrenophora tritici-repentis Pt-1C-BFP]|uniref:Uncharacterized protein n=1 Tax=Pyrenophora tritici-repentis (strain Pt-1C-BFP) TaxID=426418 RepID=B2WJG1_PYRTR|nr:uncharacterized protein PTRG_10120 [Pyrenophora tritici-repentis Pt-1C-BFP]EDU43171.1 conserved hypothetical protein [Pyrenophora tritici-repentis Pt-1C-BFP]